MTKKKDQKKDEVDGGDNKEEEKTEDRTGDRTDEAECSNAEVDEKYRKESCSSLFVNPTSTPASLSRVSPANVNEAGPSHQREAESEVHLEDEKKEGGYYVLNEDPLRPNVPLHSYRVIRPMSKNKLTSGNISEAGPSNKRIIKVEESPSGASSSRSELDEEPSSGGSSSSSGLNFYPILEQDLLQRPSGPLKIYATTENEEIPSTNPEIASTSRGIPSPFSFTSELSESTSTASVIGQPTEFRILDDEETRAVGEDEDENYR